MRGASGLPGAFLTNSSTSLSITSLLRMSNTARPRACPLAFHQLTSSASKLPAVQSFASSVQCMFSQPLQHPAFVRRTKHAGKGEEDVGYAYVVVQCEKGLVLCRCMYISVLDMHKTIHIAPFCSTLKPEIQYTFNMNYEIVHLTLL
jgi:hypothetical protein